MTVDGLHGLLPKQFGEVGLKTCVLISLVAIAIAGKSMAAPQHKASNVAPAISAKVSPAESLPPTPPPHVIPETGTLNTEDVLTILKAEKTAAVDQFAPEPSVKYISRDFQIILDEDKPIAKYDRESTELDLIVYTSGSFSISRERTNLGSAEGQNAYGAKTTFTRSLTTQYAVKPIKGFQDSSLVYHGGKIDGDLARVFSEAVRIRLSGTIEKSVPPSYLASIEHPEVIRKSNYEHAATISEPYENSTVTYQLNCLISKIEIIDPRTGLVAASWNIK